MQSLEPVNPYESITSNLSGGASVVFDVPWTEHNDTPEQHPVTFWLEVCPTADETDPD